MARKSKIYGLNSQEEALIIFIKVLTQKREVKSYNFLLKLCIIFNKVAQWKKFNPLNKPIKSDISS